MVTNKAQFKLNFSLFQISVFQASAWEYNERRKQFYLHEFLIQQPDFNYRSPKLVEEMKVSIVFTFLMKTAKFCLL